MYSRQTQPTHKPPCMWLSLFHTHTHKHTNAPASLTLSLSLSWTNEEGHYYRGLQGTQLAHTSHKGQTLIPIRTRKLRRARVSSQQCTAGMHAVMHGIQHPVLSTRSWLCPCCCGDRRREWNIKKDTDIRTVNRRQ